MASQRYSPQYFGRTANHARSPTANQWSVSLPTPSSPTMHSTGHRSMTNYPSQQETMHSLPMQRSNPYTGYPAPAPASSMTATASYGVPSAPQSIGTPQQLYMHSAAYVGDTYVPRHPRAEVSRPLYSRHAPHMSEAVLPAPSIMTDAQSTTIHQGMSYPQTAYTDQYRETLYGAQHVPSPVSPASSSSSNYQSVSPYPLVGTVNLPPVVEPIPFLPADPVQRVPCLWRGCNIQLDDISTAGIKRHIRDFHGDLSRASQKDRKICLWDDGSVCSRELDAASFAKHIASVHLKSTAQECEYCHNMIGRADSLARHKRDHCPQRPRK